MRRKGKQYKNGNLISSIAMPGSKYYAHKSVVGLKSGKVLLAGIEGKVNDTERFVQEKWETIQKYNPFKKSD